jgi:hypothetical protein
MSTLPFISHHLFVAAMDRQSSRKPSKMSSPEPAGSTSAIPLEVVDWSEPATETSARPLRASPDPSRL